MFAYDSTRRGLAITAPLPSRQLRRIQQRCREFQANAGVQYNNAAELLRLIDNSLATNFFPLSLLIRLGKWCNFRQPAEYYARNLVHAIFGLNSASFWSIPPRVVGQRGLYIPNGTAQVVAWAQEIERRWSRARPSASASRGAPATP